MELYMDYGFSNPDYRCDSDIYYAVLWILTLE